MPYKCWKIIRKFQSWRENSDAAVSRLRYFITRSLRGEPPSPVSMRLLLIASEFPPGPGGIGTHAFQLATHLQSMGWEVSVIATQAYTSSAEVESFNQRQDFPVTRWRTDGLPLLKLAHRWRIVTQTVRQFQPDVVLFSGQRALWLSGWLSLATHTHLIAVVHGTELKLGAQWERTLTRRAIEAADIVICVSHYTRQHMHSAGIHPRAVHVIPNGADDQLFRPLSADVLPNLRAAWDVTDRVMLLTVGNLTERKGHDVVIRAMPEIGRHVPGACYFIVGLPTDQQSLYRLAKELGVAKAVRFLGRVDNNSLVELLNLCDVFVMTSRQTLKGDIEGYGIAVLEAALCGKPAVVTTDSGLQEAILPGTTGLAVPQDDPKATSVAVLELLQDEQRRLKMGQLARQRALDEQTWRIRAQAYNNLLLEVLAQ